VSGVIILLVTLLLPPQVSCDPGARGTSRLKSPAIHLDANGSTGDTSGTGHLQADPQPFPLGCLLPVRLDIPPDEPKDLHGLLPPLPPEACLSFLTSVPPELPGTWQFTSRNAPNIRAPTTA
jgi:hypothetical protein